MYEKIHYKLKKKIIKKKEYIVQHSKYSWYFIL